MKLNIEQSNPRRIAWSSPRPRTRILTPLSAVCLLGFALSSQASLLTWQAAEIGAGSWNDLQWQTNGAGTKVSISPSAAAAAGNDYELVSNGTPFTGNTIGTAYACSAARPPTSAWQFFANSLTIDSGTVLSLKNAGGQPFYWTNGGLILQGGCGMITRDATPAYDFRGKIVLGPSGGTVYSMGQVMGSGGVGAMRWNPSQLSGSADLAMVNQLTTKSSAAQFNANQSNTWSGTIQVKSCYLQLNGYNPLGLGNIVCDPFYDVSALWTGGVVNGPATLEPMSDIACPGTLAIQNGGKMILHQTVTFSAASVEFTPLSAGTHTFDELNANYPANFPAPGSGSIIVGPINVAPATPLNPFTVNGHQQVTVGWSGGGNASGYIVRRSATSGSGYADVASVDVTVNKIVDTGLTDGTPYFYVIVATNGFGQSAPSAELVGRPNPIVTGLVAVSGIGQVALSWNPFPGALSYTVQRGDVSGGPYYTNLVTGLTATNYVDVFPPGSPFQTVYYTVFATLASGSSGNSAEAAGTEGLALKEEWTAMSLTNTLADGAPVTDWVGNLLSSVAHADLGGGTLTPTFALHATPTGKPTVRFSQTVGPELLVSGANSPIGGLTSFSETLVFRLNAVGRDSGNWYGQTGISDAEQGGVTFDWGTAVDASGRINFGIGSGDVTDPYTNFFAVGGFHVAVLVWDSATGQIRMTLDNNPTQTYFNGPAGNPRNFGDIHIGHSQSGPSIDGDIAEIGIYNAALPIAIATNVAAQLTATYGVTVGSVTITNFIATPNPVPKGQSTTLSWSVQQGAAVSITPSNGLPAYTTGANGSGSVAITPTADTTFTLHATLNGIIGISNIVVQVLGTASNSLIDVWVASDLTNTANGNLTDGAPVNLWLSRSNRVASLDQNQIETPPVFVADGGFGLPVVSFQSLDPAVINPGYLNVPASNSVVGGLTAFTIATTFRPNTNFPPTLAQGAWFGEVAIVDDEQPGADQDWGTTINSAGNCSFGIGNPDQTIHGNAGASILDGQYHTMVAAWSGGAQAMRLYVDGHPAAALNGTMGAIARNAVDMSIGGPHAGGYNQAKVFNGDIAEIRFYNVALPTNECLSVCQDLDIKYGVTIPGLVVSNFTANPPVVTNGQTTTLSWNVPVTAGITVSLSGIGDVTARTVNGFGSTNVIPTMDTNYVLTVSLHGHSVSADLSVDTHQTAASSKIDSFLASDLTSLNNGEFVNPWTSHSGTRAAALDGAAGDEPRFVAAGVNGKPTVSFSSTELRLPAASSIVGGLNSFTIAIVFRQDPDVIPDKPPQNWYGEVAIVDDEIGGVTYDWGTSINSNGNLSFGTGSSISGPTTLDNNLHDKATVLDGKYHILVGTWGAFSGVMALYVDGSLDNILVTNVSNVPRRVNDMTIGGPCPAYDLTKAFNGAISEISFYADDLQTNQVAFLVESLAATYGIDLTHANAPIDLITTGSGFGFSAPGHFNLSWNAAFGAHYTVWKKLALTDATWTSIGSVTNSANTVTEQFTDTAATSGSAFYRISSP